jgi:transmembrane sensor
MTHNPPSDMPPSIPSTDWEALARRVTGESSPEESARIDEWLAGHPEQSEILATLDNAMSRMADDIPPDIDIEGALQKVRERRDSLGKRPLQVQAGGAKRTPARPVWKVAVPALAASAILAIGVLSWTSLREGTSPVAATAQPRMLATGVGIRDSLTLPDGSRVILGPMSSIKVGSDFESGTRDVEVAGDAWFEVTHDEKRPFTVHAGGATIVDIGTEFTVRSSGTDGVSVSVTQGSVSLAPANVSGSSAVILQAGDNGRLQKDGRIVTSRGTVTQDDVAWMNGRLVFRETPVAEVASVIHRWYGIELKMSDSSIMNRRITATFAGETPDGMLEVLGLVLGAEIERRGDSAVVSPLGGRVR